ncbi:MAG: hypothetical protein HY359_14400 [Candidatus Rokubacteria bacterium]|nr:hypothetical protein [Candidatus Rokubacteria bacterium]
MIPVLCPGCRSPVPADTVKCPWCGRNVNQGSWDDDRTAAGGVADPLPSGAA